MLLSVVANLGLLGYFKYGQFFLDNFSVFFDGGPWCHLPAAAL